jgi:hypothetical protein
LAGGLEHFLFSPIVGMMIQSDELIFFRGVGSTTKQLGELKCHLQHRNSGFKVWDQMDLPKSGLFFGLLGNQRRHPLKSPSA